MLALNAPVAAAAAAAGAVYAASSTFAADPPLDDPPFRRSKRMRTDRSGPAGVAPSTAREGEGPTGAVGDMATAQSAYAGTFGATAGFASAKVCRPARREIPKYVPKSAPHHLMKSTTYEMGDGVVYANGPMFPATMLARFHHLNWIDRGHLANERVGQRVRMTSISFRGHLMATEPASPLVEDAPLSYTVIYMVFYQPIATGVMPTSAQIFGIGTDALPTVPFGYQHSATRERFYCVQRFMWQVHVQSSLDDDQPIRKSSVTPFEMTIPLDHVASWNFEGTSGALSNAFTGNLFAMSWSDCPVATFPRPAFVGQVELTYHDL